MLSWQLSYNWNVHNNNVFANQTKISTCQAFKTHIDRFERVTCYYSTIMWMGRQIQHCFE